MGLYSPALTGGSGQFPVCSSRSICATMVLSSSLFIPRLLYKSDEPSPALAVSLPFSTKPMRSSQRWNGAIAVRPKTLRSVAVSRKPVVW